MKSCHTVGIGFDSHVYSRKGILVLGAVRFPKISALKGHSDGDALLHALIDSLLGCAGLGDIGDFFPDTAKKTKGISSLLMLKKTMKRLKEKGLKPQHVDFTILAERPRFSAAKSKMKTAIAKAIHISPSSVNIKAKTPEGLCLFAKNDGVAVWCVATVTQHQ